MQRLLAVSSVVLLGVTGLASCQSPARPAAPAAPAAPVAAAPASAAAPAPAAAPTAPNEPVPLGRLPAEVRPTHESLALDIDPRRDRFGGTAEISLQIAPQNGRPHARIWLHGRGLAVSSASFVLASGETVAAHWEEVDPSGVVRVTPAAPVSGEVTLRVVYDAAYDPALVGVYRVTTAAGPAVFSKFEAIYARRAFPCFDEPAFKIPWDVALTVPADADALGNMPVAETAPVPGGDGAARRRVRFQTTPALPSYLVAFAAGPFDRRGTELPASAERPQPLPIGAVAMRGRGQDTAYALSEARALVAEQERYFGIGFPFPKLDLVAVPDFQSGAMENAGAITFRDSRLLVDDRVASLGDRIAVTSVIAHEAAHQWFGDYVTMPWWDDLWLNEGFATFLDTKTLRAVRPELEAEVTAAYQTNTVMRVDALAAARRIRQPIETPHDITNAFDGITYEKGAAVLTMLEHFTGDEPFRRGLHEYLTGHARGNATTAELVAALTAASGKDLAPLIATFLDQPGVPVVTATSRCDGGRGRVELAQAAWRAVGSKAPAGGSWRIPVCLRYGAGAGKPGAKLDQLCTVLDAPSATVELPVCADWVMANADAAGYYRTAPPATDLARLRDRGMARLSTVERVRLGHDLEAAFASAALPGADVLRALEPLARDPHGAVAQVPFALLGSVDGDFLGQQAAPDPVGDPAGAKRRAAFRARVVRLYAPAVAALGWTPAAKDSAWRRRFRAGLLGFLALRIEDPSVLAEASRRGHRLLGLDGAGRTGPRLDAVAPDLGDVALGAAARTGGPHAFDALVTLLTHTDDAQLRNRALTALGEARDPAVVGRALDLALDPRLRQNERLVALDRLLGKAETRDAAWRWLTAHFDELAPMLPDRFAGQIPRSIRMCNPAQIAEVRAFFAPRVEQLTGGPRNLAQALETAEQCVARVEAQRASVFGYVDGR